MSISFNPQQAAQWTSDIREALESVTDTKSGRRREEAYNNAPTTRTVKEPDGKPPQLAYMWEVSFNGMFPEDGERLTLFAQSTSIPTMMNEPIKKRYAGVEYTYAGRNNSPKVFRVSLWDDQKLNAYHYFQKWVNTINDPVSGKGVNPLNYMRSITLKLLDNTGESTKITSEFTFDMCFPTEISEISLSYEMSAIVTFDVIFSFNRRSSKGAQV